MSSDAVDRLVRETLEVPFRGWDFSVLGDRIVLEPPPRVGLALVVETVNSATCAIVNRLLIRSRSFVRTLSWTRMPSIVILE